jgi:hypothetical protein
MLQPRCKALAASKIKTSEIKTIDKENSVELASFEI